MFNYECLEILRDSFGHFCKTLLSFYFSYSFCFEFLTSRYITGLNQTFRLKSNCRLNLLRAFVFNFECLDILQDSFEHLSKKLLSFEFAQSFRFQL